MTKVLAHRGFSGKYPENTMIAFEKAIEFGCDGMEIDVQLTSDGVPVIIHDELVDRTTDGKGYVASYTYENLKKLNAAVLFESEGLKTAVPSLEEFFNLIKNTNDILNIELKNSILPYNGMEQKVIDLIRKYNIQDRCVLSSFNHESVIRCRKLAPEIDASFITSCILYDVSSYLHNADVQGLQCKYHSLTKEYVKDLQDKGIVLFPWTPNSPEDIRFLCDIGVDYIITNDLHNYKKSLEL